jgi:hypothetical protein
MDRPPADPAKLLSAWTEWEAGETPPGRVMSNLKTGGLRDVLEHLADEAPAPDLLAAWMLWEAGERPPLAVLTDLRDAGARDLLAGLAVPREPDAG